MTTINGIDAEEWMAKRRPPAGGHFYILAIRSAGSVFGAASRPVKSDGKVMTFPDFDAAEAEANRLNQAVASPNVTYQPRRGA